MRKLRIGLLPKIILAIVLGIGFGNLFSFPFIRIFVTFNALFSELLGFSIPLIILGLVTVAIADIGKGAGRMLLITVLIAYMATVLSGLFAYFAGNAFFPSLISPGTGMSDVTQSQGVQPYFSIAIPPMMSVMTALVLSRSGFGRHGKPWHEGNDAGFSGDYHQVDRQGYYPIAAHLYLRDLSEYDPSGRSGKGVVRLP